MPLLSADDLCTGVQAILAAKLPGLAASKGLTPVTKWDQLPTTLALQAANLPAGAISSPGLATVPVRLTTGYDATWQLEVAVFDRGRDYNETASKVRDWAAVVRQVLVQNPTLGGVAATLKWVGESYAQLPDRSAARTIGGCSVLVNVTARSVIDIAPYAPPDQPGLPVVESTQSTITVR